MALIVELVNLSGVRPVSDYSYRVHVSGQRTLAHGVIREHRRADGWAALLQRVIDESGRRPDSPAIHRP